MALTATMHRFEVSLSDVDRDVYEALDLRMARHPSETMRFLLTRMLAYCLSYEEGIAFSKGGVSSTDEPAVSVRDPTGLLLAWIEVGSPSAERLHKAAKASRRVAVFTHTELTALRREATSTHIHKAHTIEVFRVDPALLDELERAIQRNAALEVVRNDGMLYVTIEGRTIEGEIARTFLGD
ncbi:MAG: YaeQ family protein [Deltaproteobacteria bacterium]|nr:YaeQ family protein [Deltaproteobacteria bacterium]